MNKERKRPAAEPSKKEKTQPAKEETKKGTDKGFEKSETMVRSQEMQTPASPAGSQYQYPQQETGTDPSLYLQHPYLYAHPNLPIAYQSYPCNQAYPQPGYQSSSPYTPIVSPVYYYPIPPPAPVQPKEKEKETPHERLPERVYLNVSLVLVAVSSLSLFLYSMVYLFLFSRVQWDPASFPGIWGLGALYTLFAVVLGVASATLGIVTSVLIYTRARYKLCLIMILIMTIAGIIQVNPVSIPFSVAGFVLVSMGQILFKPIPEVDHPSSNDTPSEDNRKK